MKFSKKKKVVVHLSGGLGNQMFQYAIGIAIAKRNSFILVIDTVSGFINDKVYNRNYMLARFRPNIKRANFFERLPFLIEKAKYKILKKVPMQKNDYFYGTYYHELSNSFNPDINQVDLKNNIFLKGYWQNEEYFINEKIVIANEFSINPPKTEKIISLSKEIQEANSISIGIRLYEEVPIANSHIHKITGNDFYQKAIGYYCNLIENPHFFIFSINHPEPICKLLSSKARITYITREDGFEDDIESFWLMSQSNKFIISNSTYYWWAAWLAEARNPDVSVIASDLFPNRNTIPKRWNKI